MRCYMKDKFFVDLGNVMDEIFDAAQNLGNAFKDGFTCSGGWHWDENVDYYPAYSYPPANVYLTKDKQLVFEFALSGFEKDNISLLFQGNHMVLTVKTPDEQKEENYKDVRFLKRRLKLREIIDQKYYVPAHRFDREQVTARYKNGLLRIIIPPKENATKEEGIKVDIKDEDLGSDIKGGSK